MSASAAILALPPPAWDAIHTEFPLPRQLRANVGPATKIVGRFDRSRPVDVLTDSDVGWLWSLPRRDGPAVDLAFASGERALRWSGNDIGALRASLAHELSLVLGHDSEATVYHVADWPQEPGAVGYSYLGIGELTTTGQLLADGLDRIQFAGDWASFGFRGYMEGALESGRRSARNLLDRL